MVFQNRVDNIVSCEFPSGYVEKDEDVVLAALRELEEETGFVAKEWKEIDSFISSIGTESSLIHLVYIDNAEKLKDQDLDADEYINYELFKAFKNDDRFIFHTQQNRVEKTKELGL